MRQFISCGVSDGSTGQMVFTCSLPLLSVHKYQLAGQLVQSSVRNGGPGAQCATVLPAGWARSGTVF